MIGASGVPREPLRTSSRPVRNQDFEQYPCAFRMGYFVPSSIAAAWHCRAMAMAVIAMSSDNLCANVSRVPAA